MSRYNSFSLSLALKFLQRFVLLYFVMYAVQAQQRKAKPTRLVNSISNAVPLTDDQISPNVEKISSTFTPEIRTQVFGPSVEPTPTPVYLIPTKFNSNATMRIEKIFLDLMEGIGTFEEFEQELLNDVMKRDLQRADLVNINRFKISRVIYEEYEQYNILEVITKIYLFENRFEEFLKSQYIDWYHPNLGPLRAYILSYYDINAIVTLYDYSRDIGRDNIFYHVDALGNRPIDLLFRVHAADSNHPSVTVERLRELQEHRICDFEHDILYDRKIRQAMTQLDQFEIIKPFLPSPDHARYHEVIYDIAMHAIEHRYWSVVEGCLNFTKLDINTQSGEYEGKTIPMRLMESGEKNRAYALMRRSDANPYILEKDSRTILHYAALIKDTESARRLIKRYPGLILPLAGAPAYKPKNDVIKYYEILLAKKPEEVAKIRELQKEAVAKINNSTRLLVDAYADLPSFKTALSEQNFADKFTPAFENWWQTYKIAKLIRKGVRYEVKTKDNLTLLNLIIEYGTFEQFKYFLINSLILLHNDNLQIFQLLFRTLMDNSANFNKLMFFCELVIRRGGTNPSTQNLLHNQPFMMNILTKMLAEARHTDAVNYIFLQNYWRFEGVGVNWQHLFKTDAPSQEIFKDMQSLRSYFRQPQSPSPKTVTQSSNQLYLPIIVAAIFGMLVAYYFIFRNKTPVANLVVDTQAVKPKNFTPTLLSPTADMTPRSNNKAHADTILNDCTNILTEETQNVTRCNNQIQASSKNKDQYPDIKDFENAELAYKDAQSLYEQYLTKIRELEASSQKVYGLLTDDETEYKGMCSIQSKAKTAELTWLAKQAEADQLFEKADRQRIEFLRQKQESAQRKAKEAATALKAQQNIQNTKATQSEQDKWSSLSEEFDSITTMKKISDNEKLIQLEECYTQAIKVKLDEKTKAPLLNRYKRAIDEIKKDLQTARSKLNDNLAQFSLSIGQSDRLISDQIKKAEDMINDYEAIGDAPPKPLREILGVLKEKEAEYLATLSSSLSQLQSIDQNTEISVYDKPAQAHRIVAEYKTALKQLGLKEHSAQAELEKLQQEIQAGRDKALAKMAAIDASVSVSTGRRASQPENTANLLASIKHLIDSIRTHYLPDEVMKKIPLGAKQEDYLNQHQIMALIFNLARLFEQLSDAALSPKLSQVRHHLVHRFYQAKDNPNLLFRLVDLIIKFKGKPENLVKDIINSPYYQKFCAEDGVQYNRDEREINDIAKEIHDCLTVIDTFVRDANKDSLKGGDLYADSHSLESDHARMAVNILCHHFLDKRLLDKRQSDLEKYLLSKGLSEKEFQELVRYFKSHEVRLLRNAEMHQAPMDATGGMTAVRSYLDMFKLKTIRDELIMLKSKLDAASQSSTAAASGSDSVAAGTNSFVSTYRRLPFQFDPCADEFVPGIT